MDGLILDPDCRDGFKHASCAGGPCQCPCHIRPEDHDAAIG